MLAFSISVEFSCASFFNSFHGSILIHNENHIWSKTKGWNYLEVNISYSTEPFKISFLIVQNYIILYWMKEAWFETNQMFLIITHDFISLGIDSLAVASLTLKNRNWLGKTLKMKQIHADNLYKKKKKKRIYQHCVSLRYTQCNVLVQIIGLVFICNAQVY